MGRNSTGASENNAEVRTQPVCESRVNVWKTSVDRWGNISEGEPIPVSRWSSLYEIFQDGSAVDRIFRFKYQSQFVDADQTVIISGRFRQSKTAHLVLCSPLIIFSLRYLWRSIYCSFTSYFAVLSKLPTTSYLDRLPRAVCSSVRQFWLVSEPKFSLTRLRFCKPSP